MHNEEVVTSKVFNQKKKWMEDLPGEGEDEKAERPTVEQECPKCNNDQMYFNTR